MDGFSNRATALFNGPIGVVLFLTALTSPSLTLAATLTVNTSDDAIAADGMCSLREAIINANNNNQTGSADCIAGESALPDVIRFAESINSSPIVLSLTGTNENDAETGDLDISASLIIKGNGASSETVIDGNSTDRVFEIRNDADVQLLDLTVTNGGSVTLGAGIYVSSGRLTMQDARVSSNLIEVNSGSGSGAGIHSLGNLFLTRVSIQANEIDASETDTVFGYGAGIYVGNGGTLSLITSVVEDNLITTVNGSAHGGGLYIYPNVGATTGVSSSVFSGDQVIVNGTGAASGGGIYHRAGNLGIARGVFVNNRVTKTSSGGSSATGGAIAAIDPLSMSNSTISGNRVEGIDYAGGGGLLATDSAVLTNVTITQNAIQADPTVFADGGGVRIILGGLDMTNSIIAGNTSTSESPDCSGNIVSSGYNLIGNNADCTYTAGTGDIVGDVNGGGAAVNPILGTLAANGGEISIGDDLVPMLTHAPQPGSPAIDSGDPLAPGSVGTCSSIDQLGFGRAIDGDGDGVEICDIGAVEFREELIQDTGSGGGSSDSESGGGSGGGGALSPFLMLAGLLVAIRRRFSRAHT